VVPTPGCERGGRGADGGWLPVVATVALVTLTVLGLNSYHRRTAGLAEVREVTQRVVFAVARGDRAALTSDPLLHGHLDTVAWLLRHRPALAGRYRVTACRNGAGGHWQLPAHAVSHLGFVSTASGDLLLGFLYDRRTGEVEFVTASFE
jgi:hypothetical protein